MKKIFSKLLTAVLALVLVGNVIAAENDGKITVTSVMENKQYGIFRIFDATLSGEGEDVKVSYTINSNWANFFNNAGAKYIVADSEETKELSAIVVGKTIKRINITEDNIAEFAAAAQAYSANLTAIDTKTASDETVEFTGLAYGYYLVFPYSASGASDGNASMVSLTTTTPEASISAKAKYPDIKKEADDISVDVGQTVTYTITVNVPDTTGYKTYDYIVTDVMDNGLTFDGLDSIHVYKNSVAKDNELTSFFTKSSNGNGFKVAFDIIGGVKATTPAFEVDDELLVVYTATVNENAINKVEVNKANLTYGRNPNGEPEKTPDVETINYSTKIEVIKVDGADGTTPLEGAKFVLKKTIDNTTYYYHYNATDKKVEWVASIDNADVKISDKDGKLSFDGIEDGTYLLEETEAPLGFNKLTEDVEVEVTRETVDKETEIKTTSETVENNSGTVLPETGGIGTTLFVVIGSIVALGAALVIVTNKRMANEAF